MGRILHVEASGLPDSRAAQAQDYNFAFFPTDQSTDPHVDNTRISVQNKPEILPYNVHAQKWSTHKEAINESTEAFAIFR